jgi:transposase-like protein
VLSRRKQPAGLAIAVARRSNLAMIPEAKRTQILKALQSNPNWAAVARQVGGVSRATVGVIARQLGIIPSRTKLSPEAREKIVEALRINPNASAVARKIGGIDPSTVSAIAKKADIRLAAAEIGKRKRLSSATRARIVEALVADPNASRVAREVGDVSARTVGKIAKEANIRLAAENPEKRKRLSPNKRARIVEALRGNPNASMVARQIGDVSAKTVQKIAKQAKIELAAVNGHGKPARAQTGAR